MCEPAGREWRASAAVRLADDAPIGASSTAAAFAAPLGARGRRGQAAVRSPLYICSADSCLLGNYLTILCTVKIEDRMLRDLHRATSLAGRPGIAVPSQDLVRETQAMGRRAVAAALHRLTRSGRVLSVRKDLLVLPDATGRVTVTLPDLIEVVAPERHLITGARALDMNGLTDQYSFIVVVLVPTPVQGFTYRGEEAVFLTTRPARIWGWQPDGPHIASPERAILDGVSHPRYGVTLHMAIRALQSAVDQDLKFLKRLLKAARKYDSAATARRVGLIVDRLCGPAAAQPFHQLIGDSRSPVVLRPGGERTGEINRQWRLIMNASVEPEEVTT